MNKSIVEITNILTVENYLNNIKGVIFDLDDTVYSEREYVWSGFQEIAKHFPDVSNLAEKLWSVFLNGDKAIDKVFDAEGLAQYKSDALKIYRFHTPNIHLYPGVAEMLQRIMQSGRQIGIITDGRPEGQRAKLFSLNLNIQNVIITDELGGPEFRKPNPIAFKLMKEKMQLQYKEMIYIGDNLQKDFIAPSSLGMRNIYFNNPSGLYRISNL